MEEFVKFCKDRASDRYLETVYFVMVFVKHERGGNRIIKMSYI